MTIVPTEPQTLRVEFDEEPGDVLVAHVHGPLDLSTAPTLDRVLQRYLDASAARRMVIDLSDVQFLGCQGVTVLVRLARWAQAHEGCERPCLVGLSRSGRRVMELVEVIDMFTVQDAVEGTLLRPGVMSADDGGDRRGSASRPAAEGAAS